MRKKIAIGAGYGQKKGVVELEEEMGELTEATG